jgi:cobalt-zinc-cadmium efflux system membrane fusion protein
MKTHSLLTSLPIVLLAATALFAACGGTTSNSPAPAKAAAEPARLPLVQKAEVADWCPEHAVPESVCTRCNAKLVAEFQAKGDWCKEHSLPESQCVACHPELAAKFQAMAPKQGG